MPASLATSGPPISPGEMQLLLSRAGLVLNPGQVADLVLAWRQVAGLIASIPRDRPLVDDFACAFRLLPPASADTPVLAQAPRKPKVATSRAKTAAKSTAKAKTAPKPRAARPAGRKRVRRGR